MSDSYDALSRGVAQGIVCPRESLQGWKLGEVVKYSTQDYGAAYSVTFFVVMNKARWSSMPAEAQRAIEQVNAEWIDRTGSAWDTMDQAGGAFAAGLGVTILPLSAAENARWEQAVEPLFDEYLIVGTYELVALGGAIAIGLSLPLTSWVRGHIYVDSFVARLPRLPRAILNIATRLLVLGLFFLLGWNLVKYALDLRSAGEVSPTLRVPFFPVTLGVGLSGLLECLVMVADIVKISTNKYE